MLSNRQKYLLAAAASLTGCTLSIVWYTHAKQAFNQGDQSGEKLAVLQFGKGDVERKPGERLIWQPLTEGAGLQNGDTVRTGTHGEGRVSLLESGTVIALEPDSLIVIEKSKGTVSLDLLSGGLFIKSENKDSKVPAPMIKAGGTKLSLGHSGAEMSLSMDAGKAATLSVSKGNIDVSANGKQVTLKEGAAGAITDEGMKEQKVIQVISPTPNAVLDIGTTGNAPIVFTWTPIAENLLVYLETGATRSDLKRTAAPGVLASSGTLALVLPAGNFYWQLKAEDAKSGKSATSSLVYRASTIALSPPTLVSPKKGDQFFLVKNMIDIPTSWTNPQSSEKTILVVAKTRDFKEIFFQKTFEGTSEGSIEFKAAGTYYWRVLAFFNGRAKPLSSEVSEFIINDRLILKAPLPIRPDNDAVIPLAKAKSAGIFLDWGDVPGIENYQVSIRAPAASKATEETTTGAQVRLEDIHPGVYTWKVKSLGPSEQSSDWSKTFTFRVLEMATLAWTAPEGSEYHYRSQDAVVPLEWEKGSEHAQKWRLRFGKDKEELLTKEWQIFPGTKAVLKLPAAGAYLFDVQALDKEGLVLAVGKFKKIDVQPVSPLAAPEFANFDNKIKKANADGSIKLQWKSIKDAAGYVVFLHDPEQKDQKKIPENSTTLELTGLIPGKYKIQIATINIRGEQGKPGDVKYIEVPNTSNISAPKVNSIKVH